MRLRNSAFTLVEVLIVISLLGAVTIVSALGLAKQLSKARDAQRKLQLKQLNKALEEYYDSTLCYPLYLPACGEKIQLENSMLLDSVPCDPLTHLPYLYETDNAACNSQYKVYANLENDEDTDIAYVGCSNGCGPDCNYNYGFSSPNTGLDFCSAPIIPTPSSEVPPQVMPTPTIDLLEYVCAPGLGNDGHCTLFVYPELSECPKIWIDDPTCNNECDLKSNHCKSSKGKND